MRDRDLQTVRTEFLACILAACGLLLISTEAYSADVGKQQSPAKQASIATSAKQAACDGWELDQENRAFGPQRWLITNQYARLTSPSTGMVVIYRLADDTLLQYNPHNKLFYEIKSPNVKTFNSHSLAKLFGVDLRRFDWVKGRTTKALNVHLTEYCPAKRADLKMSQSEADDFQVILNTCDGYWRCDDIKPPARISEIISNWIGFPAAPGVPFSLSARIDNLPQKLIETTVCKRTKVDVSAFFLPTGYTRAQTEHEMLLNGEQQDMLEELMPERPAKR